MTAVFRLLKIFCFQKGWQYDFSYHNSILCFRFFSSSSHSSGRPHKRLYALLTAADGFSIYSGRVTATDETALYEPSWLNGGLCGISMSRNFCTFDRISRKSHPPSQGQRTIFCWVCLGEICLLYTSPSPRDLLRSRMPSSAWKKFF